MTGRVYRPAMIRALTAIALASLALVACSKTPAASAEPAAAPAAASPPSRRATATVQGVQLRDTGLHMVVYAGDSDVKFGTPMKDAVAALDGMLGPGSKPEVNSECGAGPITFVQWPDGLSGLFQDGRFVGWSLDAKSPKGTYVTDRKIGVGSTRAELTAAYPDVKIEESTLGTEFTTGDYDGILGGKGADATVETLWAGISCVFR